MNNLNTTVRKYQNHLKDNLQNNRRVFFKSAKVIKDKERLRSCPVWEGTEE
jgi:hypothetical protein